MTKDYCSSYAPAPIAGREEDDNRWYSEQHLKDAAVPEFVSAQRFKLTDPTAEGAPAQPYLAPYNMGPAIPPPPSAGWSN